ncbi:hypothetical protein [Mycoplasmopsis felis]|uniref:hypothetical protein n=1 Tax=Mycoplasmopsis felis TaxID=33923 RepID=UPI003A5C8470
MDPSIHNFISKQGNISIEEFTNILNNQSGLLGVSEISSDMRDLTKAAEQGNSDRQICYWFILSKNSRLYFNLCK